MKSMGQPQFVHLHVHTDFSLLDGACETSELLDEASRQKMPAVAITDHGNLFAAANFFYEASKRDVKAIIGCEVYVAKGSRHDRGEKNGPPSGKQNGEDPETFGRGNNHLVLLSEIARGLSQSHQAGVRGISGRLLLQAAHRLRSAGQTQQRLDRAFRMPERSGDGSGGGSEIRSSQRKRLPFARYFREKQFLPRDSGSGTRNRKGREPRTGPPIEGIRHSFGGHERLPLSAS